MGTVPPLFLGRYRRTTPIGVYCDIWIKINKKVAKYHIITTTHTHKSMCIYENIYKCIKLVLKHFDFIPPKKKEG